MPKTVHTTHMDELLALAEDCPDYIVSFETCANGFLDIELVDYASGETFRL